MSPLDSISQPMTSSESHPQVEPTTASTGDAAQDSSKSYPLSVRNLSVTYHRKAVLWNVNLDVGAGRIVGVVGPNGAGKTTLIKAIMGLLPLQSGTVKSYGRELKKHRGEIGYVPQRETVDWDFPVTVRDVVMMGTYGRVGLFRRPGKKERELCDQCLKQVHMAPFAHRQISNLSGGQQQRVFLARALAQQAGIYLMDEPFAGVDAATESAIFELLRKLRDDGCTIMVIHHDLESAREYFDDILLLNRRVIAYGPTAEVFTAENLRSTYGGRLTIMPDLTGPDA